MLCGVSVFAVGLRPGLAVVVIVLVLVRLTGMLLSQCIYITLLSILPFCVTFVSSFFDTVPLVLHRPSVNTAAKTRS